MGTPWWGRQAYSKIFFSIINDKRTLGFSKVCSLLGYVRHLRIAVWWIIVMVGRENSRQNFQIRPRNKQDCSECLAATSSVTWVFWESKWGIGRSYWECDGLWILTKVHRLSLLFLALLRHHHASLFSLWAPMDPHFAGSARSSASVPSQSGYASSGSVWARTPIASSDPAGNTRAWTLWRAPDPAGHTRTRAYARKNIR